MTHILPETLSNADQQTCVQLTHAINQMVAGFSTHVAVIALAAAAGMLISNNTSDDHQATELTNELVMILLDQVTVRDDEQAEAAQ
ncbi:hypothetical protein AAIH46_18075 [Rhizobium sp. 0TCS1.26]|uniref:hypothetical protein n=1 Tax=Rhizobium sp. 0TCS1.26 TaxID=3142623 RepID=UPI003D265A26